ncbi:MAG: HNH endonuclease [Gammaproteobacteria bacterium]|nr:HNH endonuclease [Gammaproteobacteria bacterium]
MLEDNEDTRMRLEAFRRVQFLQQNNRFISARDIRFGFQFNDNRIPLVNPQRGIFKPRQMRFLLSLKTVIPRPGREAWYDDQLHVHERLYRGDDSVEYDFMGTNPEAAENKWLHEAFQNQTPIIYFLGVAPARYEAMMPTFVADWDLNALKARLVFGLPLQEALTDIDLSGQTAISEYPQHMEERRYALRTVKQRLHQSSFREALIHAYRGRCAVSGIPEPLLLDAAHIAPDGNEQFGQPIVPNGIPLSKIHHAAFDAHLIGIDPDYRLHVSDRLLDRKDGPLLETLKQLKGTSIHLPQRQVDWPDRERLAMRFEQFKSSL